MKHENLCNKLLYNYLGICTQNERIPIRFFVEYLRNEGGHQLIFTGEWIIEFRFVVIT